MLHKYFATRPQHAALCLPTLQEVHKVLYNTIEQGCSQDFSKGGAEVMEAKALKRKNCL